MPTSFHHTEKKRYFNRGNRVTFAVKQSMSQGFAFAGHNKRSDKDYISNIQSFRFRKITRDHFTNSQITAFRRLHI